MPISVETYWAPDPILVAAEVNAVADTLMDFGPPLAAAREVIVSDIREHFEKQEDPDHKAWEEWSVNYRPVAERTNVGQILQRTKEMEDAVTARLAYKVTGHEIFVDTSGWPERWAWHQEGRIRGIPGSAEFAKFLQQEGIEPAEGFGQNVLPARPFLGVSVEAEFEIFDILDEFVDGAFAVATHPLTGATQRRIPRGMPGAGQFAKGF